MHKCVVERSFVDGVGLSLASVGAARRAILVAKARAAVTWIHS